tara:strand:- start:216 stop:386 length:171 start_codon:yes stop_codon:yes gene_type:complete
MESVGLGVDIFSWSSRNVVAAAAGRVVAVKSDEGDFCYQRSNPNFLNKKQVNHERY